MWRYWEKFDKQIHNFHTYCDHITNPFDLGVFARCAYCDVYGPGVKWNLEHILPRKYYPQFAFDTDNIVLALKLKSGFLSSYFNKALPQGLPQFTLEITLASGITAFVAQNADVAVNTYNVSEARFYAPVYQILDEGVMGAYTRQITTSPTMWVAQSFTTIINNVAAQSSKQTLQLNASFKSLNGMITLMRPSANMNDKVKNILTATNITGVVSYLYRIGGSQYPQDAVDITSVNNVQSFSCLYGSIQNISTSRTYTL